MRLSLKATLLALLLTGCDDQAGEQDSTKAAPEIQESEMPGNIPTLPGAQQDTGAELQQRYADIKTMIGDAKASDVQQCRKVAFGYKACGGPASYLIYSVQGLDEAELLQKVAEYNALAQAEAKRLGLMSDCSMVLEPGVVWVGGVCKAGPSGDLF